MNTKQNETIKRSEILDTEKVCVYCMDSQTSFSCCGENHFEDAYVTADSAFLIDSTDVEEDTEVKPCIP